MLAEKLNYLEEMEPVIQNPQELERKQSPKSIPVSRPNTINKILSVLMVMVCFAAACFIVYRYAVINKNHNKILELEKVLEDKYVEQDRLEVELAFNEDLDNIEFAAQADLNMHYPEEEQVLYIDLPAEENEKSTEVADQSKKESIWSRLLGIED